MSNCQTIHTKAKMRKMAFLQANWYKAEQYCRFHGMHLASINSAEEQKNLEDHITSFGMGNEHFWSSGTDAGEEGK